MTGETKIKREDIVASAWGEAFLREMDLIIAANEYASLLSGKTLYNDVLDEHIASLCMPLDQGLDLQQLPTIAVDVDAEHPWKEVPAALKALEGLPRGHWAVFEKSGRYDAYMSDGHGGTGSHAGHKFTYLAPTAPRLNPIGLYGQVMSMIIYLRRNQIQNRICEYSFEAADLKPGFTIKGDSYVGGKKYSKVVFDELKHGYYVGGGDAISLSLTRQGAKPKETIVSPAGFARLANLDLVMPPEFDEPDLADRLIDGFELPSVGFRI
jgi:hypothetical protein